MNNGSEYRIETDENGLGLCLVVIGKWQPEFAQVIRQENISVLRLSSAAGWKGESIYFVSGLESLKGIEVYDWKIRDVSPIFSNKALKYVGLQCEFKSAADFSALKELRICKIFWRPAAQAIFSCKSLAHLSIVGYPEEDLSSFSELGNLQRLQLMSKKLVSLKGIERLNKLRILDLAHCLRLENLDGIELCGTLETIELEACKQLSDLSPLSHLRNLRELDISDCGTIKTLKHLISCARLERIRAVGDTNIIDGNLGFLLDLPNLKEVWYADKPHYSHSREALSRLLLKK